MATDNDRETREGVELTSLDSPLFDGANATKRDLVDYVDAGSDRLLSVLQGRPLSVMRVRPGQAPFMQRNVAASAPQFVRTTTVWSQAGRREVRYVLCEDRRTLLWLANQRAVEFHVPLVRVGETAPTYLVLDLDPPEVAEFSVVVAAARLVQRALHESGLTGVVKTSGSKGLHVFVPLDGVEGADAAAATRALAVRAAALDPSLATTAYVKADRGGRVFLDSTRSMNATVAAAYSPRIRPGTTVSFPVSWEDLDHATPQQFPLGVTSELLGDSDPWRNAMPEPQQLPQDLIDQGHAIPVARVAAMHEGKRRARERREA
jgi:DNA ligase D-like protein (predicted polymerase)